MIRTFVLSGVLSFGSPVHAQDLTPPAAPPVPPISGAPATPPAPVAPVKPKAGPVTNLRCWAAQWPRAAVIHFENEDIPVPPNGVVRFDRTVNGLKFHLFYKDSAKFHSAFEMTIEDEATGYIAQVSHEDPAFHANGNMNVRLMKKDPADPTIEKTGTLFGCSQQNPTVEPPGWIN